MKKNSYTYKEVYKNARKEGISTTLHYHCHKHDVQKEYNKGGHIHYQRNVHYYKVIVFSLSSRHEEACAIGGIALQ